MSKYKLCGRSLFYVVTYLYR